MARTKTCYICQNCGQSYPQWVGKCDNCQSWNSLVEENAEGGVGGGGALRLKKRGRVIPLTSLQGEAKDPPRIQTGILELDRVTGGGFVPGSALLIGGDPGIGKSTLLTQTAARLSRLGHNIVYVSGEEAVAQIRLRAQRLKATDTHLKLAAETNVEDILSTLQEEKKLDLIIIDSIQTLWSNTAESAPGTVSQVRLSAQAMIHFAKQTNTTVILVGHVTKDGQIAGPRVVEHMVDAVLYFEGERNNHYRILRTVKNRFGPTDEIGVFEMSDHGLKEVKNPSELFLGERNENAPGSVVFAGMEGTRPVLIEIQALVAPSSLGTARRAVVGWDSNRLSMILAVLEAHCGIKFGQYDVYLNVAGGFRIFEPAADLAVACALISSIFQTNLPNDAIFFGEISLSGSIRPVSQSLPRIKEAMKLGFKKAVFSQDSKDAKLNQDFCQNSFKNIRQVMAYIKALKPHNG